jgi:hypothetical protein
LISSQIQYISTASKDGLDGRCEALGWKRLEQYLPLSEAWQLLERDSVTDPVVDKELSPEVHSTDDAYFPGLPFASIFSSCKVWFAYQFSGPFLLVPFMTDHNCQWFSIVWSDCHNICASSNENLYGCDSSSMIAG